MFSAILPHHQNGLFFSLDVNVISFPLTSTEIDADVRGGLGGGLGGGHGGGTFGGVGGVALLPVE